MVTLDHHHRLPHEIARARYFRVCVTRSSNPHAMSFVPAEEPTNPWPHPGYIELVSGGQAFRYPRVGKCIYCGKSEFIPGSGLPLSEEHVVTEGLGARLILPEASCKSCADKTKRIEGSVLRTLLWTPRRHLKIRGKNRKRNENAYPITAIVGGRDVVVNLPLTEYPAMLFLPTFNPPGSLIKRPIEYPGLCGLWGLQLNTYEHIFRRGMREFALPEIDTVRFCQLLAKISHGLAVSQLGLEGFTPLLVDFIRRNFNRNDEYPQCYDLIGGDPADYAPDNALHIIGLRFIDKNNRIFLVAELRLFANLGTPVFIAAVGEMLTSEQKAKYRVLTEARERTLDKTPSRSP